MKIKLIVVDTDSPLSAAARLKYYINSDHLDYWQYSPACAVKNIFTDFTQTN
jgi:hypothetical protein